MFCWGWGGGENDRPHVVILFGGKGPLWVDRAEVVFFKATSYERLLCPAHRAHSRDVNFI